MLRAYFVEDPGHGLRGRAVRQPEEPPDRQGDDRVDGETLGNVAHDEARTPPDCPRVRLDEAEQDADERRFPGPVGPDERHNLARAHRDVHVTQDGLASELVIQPPGFYEGI